MEKKITMKSFSKKALVVTNKLIVYIFSIEKS